ncbi:hypothetical protein CspeluHIS016_0210690 [Cutaneotrichosporon spelunceum]|uniref:Flavin reductase like domain-containing protein n=1 Tax=Cutaneotrichosporon spelunceum TaxID=1672016 RepID=A0AAD3TSS9_9TREE|nr:hypothetical protein CspeluHIS016_0210690 [Cutaneotrichosporon spelunceum]
MVPPPAAPRSGSAEPASSLAPQAHHHPPPPFPAACDEPACAHSQEPAPAKADPGDHDAEAGRQMREVLRSVAQPVVVAVARTTDSSQAAFHGATLTSFASLTLEPHPLVAFSLRLPSRMADCLRPRPASPRSGEPVPAHLCAPRAVPTRLTISLLAAENQRVADELARPGVNHADIFDSDCWDQRDPPALRRAVGCLECQVVHSLPLRDVGGVTSSGKEGSELFICRVLKAERGEGEDSLVHFQRDYFSVRK